MRWSLIAVMLFLSSCGFMTREADGDWTLVRARVDGESLRPVVGSPVTLEVERGAVSGGAGCNQYAVEADIVGGRFELFEAGGLTDEKCHNDVMRLEEDYWRSLQAVSVYRVEGDRLELEGDGVFLTFERAG